MKAEAAGSTIASGHESGLEEEENLLSKQRLLPLGLAALAAALCTAVGFVSSGTAAPQATFKAGLVSDVGRFNDKGFNQNQLTGLKRAAKQLKIQYRAVESRSAGDYLPNMASLARAGFNIVISAGLLLNDATEAVAQQFPNTKFAITDYSVANFKSNPTNIEGLTYATQQNSYLVGCLAAHMAQARGTKNISVVGGLKIPPVDTFLAGYKAGAQRCVPGTTVQIGYSQDFIDQAKCKSVAQNQLDAGSQVVFASPVRAASERSMRRRGPAAGPSASTSTSRISARTSSPV